MKIVVFFFFYRETLVSMYTLTIHYVRCMKKTAHVTLYIIETTMHICILVISLFIFDADIGIHCMLGWEG